MFDLAPFVQWLCIPLFAIVRVWGGLALTRRMGWLDRPGVDTGRTYRVPTVQGLFLVSGCLVGIMLFVP